jgi:hypothetical protein
MKVKQTEANTKKVTLTEAVDMINGIKNGEIFSVEFVKRTNGEIRLMNCRKGVTKYLAGGELKFDPTEKKLIPVFDVQKGEYRSISADAITKVVFKQTVFEVQ